MTLNRQELLPFGKDPRDVSDQLREMMNSITPVEYASEILILHLQSEASTEQYFLQFSIADLQAIYPLTEQARQSISDKIDRRICLSEAVFESLWNDYESQRINSFYRKGADILWKLCSMGGDVSTYLNRIGIDSLYKGLGERRIRTHQLGRDYWVHLIAYDRHNFFPNETIGYFYDAGEVFAQSQGQRTFEGSRLHAFLENLSHKRLKFNGILKELIRNKESQPYINQTCSGAIKQYEIAPLFFQLQEDIRVKKEKENLSESYLLKNLDTLKKTFPESLPYVVALLGLLFGYHTFYDLYYDSLNLRFYHTYKQTLDNPTVSVDADPVPEKDPYESLIKEIKNSKGDKKLSIIKIKQWCKGKDLNADTYIQRLKNDPRIKKVNKSYQYIVRK